MLGDDKNHLCHGVNPRFCVQYAKPFFKHDVGGVYCCAWGVAKLRFILRKSTMVTKENYNMVHRLELLGIGASKDRELKINLLEALRQLSVDIPVEEVREIDRLLAYGISGIPALIVDGRVVFQKVVPTVEDLRLVLNILLNDRPLGMRVKNIVVPTDFSATAENAFQYAMHLARLFGAKVRLVHIHQAKTDLGTSVLVEGQSEELHYKQELLESLAQSPVPYSGFTPLEVSSEMISGTVVDELRAISRQKDTDLIVMGSTGDTRFLGRWLGSISSEVARKAYCPVLLVPRNTKFKKINEVVYACNYHPSEETVLNKIVHFAVQTQASLHLVHVHTGKSPVAYEGHKIPVGPSPEEGGVELKLSQVSHSDVLDGLSGYARDNGAGIMVMGTNHRPFLEDLFRRNLTREMAINTSIPLMIMHFDD